MKTLVEVVMSLANAGEARLRAINVVSIRIMISRKRLAKKRGLLGELRVDDQNREALAPSGEVLGCEII